MTQALQQRHASSGLDVIADPLRWELLCELAESDRRVHELMELVGRPQNLVSYHLRALRSAGLVESRRSSADGRDTYYRARLDHCGQLLSAAAGALHPALLHPAVLRSTGLRPSQPMLSDSTPSQSKSSANGRRRKPVRVLFLCTGNSARSQIAEALLEHHSNHRIEARSAGSHPKALHPEAVRVMAERGIDITDHRPKHVRRFTRMRFDRVITLCDRIREICPEFLHHPHASHWSVADPALEGETPAGTRAAFDRIAADLDARVGYLIAELTAASAPGTAELAPGTPARTATPARQTDPRKDTSR